MNWGFFFLLSMQIKKAIEYLYWYIDKTRYSTMNQSLLKRGLCETYSYFLGGLFIETVNYKQTNWDMLC